MSYGFDEQRGSSSHTAVWVVLGVGGGILLVCGGIIAVVVGGMFWVGQRARLGAERAMVAAQEAQRVSQEQFLSQAVIAQFLTNVRQRHDEDAYNQFLSQGFKVRQTVPQFRAFLAAHPLLQTSTAQLISVPASAPGMCTLKVTVTGPGGALSFTAQMVQENGAWKIDQLTVP